MISVDELSSKRKKLFDVLGTGLFAFGFRPVVVFIALTSAIDEYFTFLSAAVVIVIELHRFARTRFWWSITVCFSIDLSVGISRCDDDCKKEEKQKQLHLNAFI